MTLAPKETPKQEMETALLEAGIRPASLDEVKAAFYIGMSRSWLRQSRCGATATPGPRFYHVGRRVFYWIPDLDEWITRQRRGRKSR